MIVETNDIDGYVWVQDSQIKILKELDGGLPPSIIPCEGIKILINGSFVDYMTFITVNDHIEILPITEIPFSLDIELMK